MSKIPVSLGELKIMENSLKDCMQIHLPVVVAFKFAKIAKAVGDELRTLEDNRKELVKKFGIEESDGSISVPDENIQKFQDEFKILLDHVVEINAQKIRIDEFGNEIELTPMVLAVLSPFITD